jgi:hypothetical protein
MYQICRHVMPNGVQCGSPALRGKAFCYFHTRLHRRAKEPIPEKEEQLRFSVLEDRSAIQIAVADVLNAIASPNFDTRRAGHLLYGLQIASMNVQHNAFILQVNAVPSITQTPDGEDLAPEKFVCEADDDCSTCDIRDSCDDYEPEEEEENEPED